MLLFTKMNTHDRVIPQRFTPKELAANLANMAALITPPGFKRLKMMNLPHKPGQPREIFVVLRSISCIIHVDL
jgi:hypothetical protein